MNITHTNKYILIIHNTRPNKVYQSLIANTYKIIVLQISKHSIFIYELKGFHVHRKTSYTCCTNSETKGEVGPVKLV